jgi:hypothetical protein
MQILHTSYAEEHGVFALQESHPMLDLHHGNRAFRSAIKMETEMYAKNIAANPVTHTEAWRATKNFPVTASVNMLVNKPRWQAHSRGSDFWEKVLGPCTEFGTKPTTVQALIDAAAKVGLKAHRVHSMLRYLYTWGDQVEIAGKRYVAVVEVKTPKQPKVA